MPLWLAISAIIVFCSLGFTAGILVATAGVISRENKAVKEGYIEINGRTYILARIIQKGDDEK